MESRFLALERQRTIEVLTEWLALESTRKPFHVVGHQFQVEVSLGGLSLRGRLDRLDEIDDAHVVIDYKTGGSITVSAWQVPRPRMPQLPFYALAMLQQKFNLAGVSFAVVRKGESASRAICAKKICCRARTRQAQLRWAWVSMSTPRDGRKNWSASPHRLSKAMRRLIRRFRREEAARACEHCHLASLCRIGDVASDDFDGEGENDE